MKIYSALTLLIIAFSTAYADAADLQRRETVVLDSARQRKIPLTIQPPQNNCHLHHACKVAFLSPGFGLGPTDYMFLSDYLSHSGYLVISIQSVLPGDPSPPDTGNLIADRTPMWTIGADNLRFVKSHLMSQYQDYDWSSLLLIGHSNGGDISSLALTQTPDLASQLITLDNRRYPIPRDKTIHVLSIRGSDFAADPSVLPSKEEATALGQCITKIPNSRHDDMTDSGPERLKTRITAIIGTFVKGNHCGT